MSPGKAMQRLTKTVRLVMLGSSSIGELNTTTSLCWRLEKAGNRQYLLIGEGNLAPKMALFTKMKSPGSRVCAMDAVGTE